MTAPAVPVFQREDLLAIIAFARSRLAAGAAAFAFRVLDPDRGRGRYPGELVDGHVHRPFRVWVELAERLGLRLLTPRTCAPPLIELCFERLDPGARLEVQLDATDATEKYGAGSAFARLSKLEDPDFVLDFADALARAKLPPRPRILDLGVGRGDELVLMARLGLAGATFVGVDHSASALAAARVRCPDARLVEADLARLADLALGAFDLVVSIGTLQSAGLDDRALLRELVQHHLTPGGAVILGFPNCRYVDGELEHGTRMKNFTQPELGLLIKDVAFYRKYLQQHDRQVFVTGKHYVLVTGARIGA